VTLENLAKLGTYCSTMLFSDGSEDTTPYDVHNVKEYDGGIRESLLLLRI